MEALKLFQHNTSFKYLWMARLVSLSVDTLVKTILILFLAEEGGNGTQVGVLLLMLTFPRMLGPFFGSIVDRFAGRRLMILCEAGKIGILLALLLSLKHIPAMFSLLVIATVISSIYSIAGRSALPAVVSEHQLAHANALFGTGLSASVALAPAAAGVFYETLGIRGLFIVCIFIQLLSIVMLSRLPALSPQGEMGAHGGYLKETMSGLRYLIDHRISSTVALGLFLSVVFLAVGGISLVFLVQDVLEASPASYGLARTIHGLGMIIAPLLLLPWINKLSPGLILVAGMGLMGIANLFSGFAPTIFLVILAQAVEGIGSGLQNLGNDTLIQQTVPRRMLGRIFGAVYTAPNIAASIAYIVGGPFQDLTSARLVFITVGAGVLLSTGIVYILLVKMRKSSIESQFVHLVRQDVSEVEILAVQEV
jgi:MFS family permease